MALVNSILVDLSTQTASLTSTAAGNQVETISYTKSTNQVTFATRAAITITGTEFIDLVNQIDILQTAILFNFTPNTNATTPFGSVQNTEAHDTGTNTWNLTCIYGATPRVVSYSGIGANGTVDLANRANSKTIDFPEWQRCLGALLLYRRSLKGFFNI